MDYIRRLFTSREELVEDEIIGLRLEAIECVRNKDFAAAGQKYEKMARMSDQMDRGQHYCTAAENFKRANAKEDALRCYGEAVSAFEGEGRWSRAAKIYEEIYAIGGRIHDLLNAIECYEAEGSHTVKINSLRCRLADYHAEREEYAEAITAYRLIAAAPYQQVAIIFMAALCYINNEDEAGYYAYVSGCAPWGTSREGVFISSLLRADTVEAFTSVCADYDYITRFTPLQTMLLLRIKKQKFELSNNETLV